MKTRLGRILISTTRYNNNNIINYIVTKISMNYYSGIGTLNYILIIRLLCIVFMWRAP